MISLKTWAKCVSTFLSPFKFEVAKSKGSLRAEPYVSTVQVNPTHTSADWIDTRISVLLITARRP